MFGHSNCRTPRLSPAPPCCCSSWVARSSRLPARRRCGPCRLPRPRVEMPPQRLGSLELQGAYELRSRDRDFGGISGILRQGDRLLLLSDRSHLFELGWTIHGAGQPFAMPVRRERELAPLRVSRWMPRRWFLRLATSCSWPTRRRAGCSHSLAANRARRSQPVDCRARSWRIGQPTRASRRWRGCRTARWWRCPRAPGSTMDAMRGAAGRGRARAAALSRGRRDSSPPTPRWRGIGCSCWSGGSRCCGGWQSRIVAVPLAVLPGGDR